MPMLMLCVVSSAFSPPLPLSSISPPLPPSPSTTWPSTRRWRLDRDEMYANARLGSRTFRVCCVLRKGRNGRRGESARHREVAEDYILFPRFVFSTIVKLTSFFPLSSPFSPIDFFCRRERRTTQTRQLLSE